MRTVTEKRATFRKLHQSGCFAIPNPWDIGTARYLGRQTKARSRLGQRSFHLLHSQFVVLLLELRDDLALVNNTTKINSNGLDAPRHFHPDRRVIVCDQGPINSHSFPDG